MMPRRRVWAHSLLSWQEMCALSVYFHSCLHCIRCCCLATSLKLLWKHARWFKNRWLWVHVMSEQKKKKKLICCYRASGKQYVLHRLNLPECVLRGFFFFSPPLLPLFLITCSIRRCAGSDVLFRRQTGTHSLTNLPSDHLLTSCLREWLQLIDLLMAQTSVITQWLIEDSLKQNEQKNK